MTARHVGRRDAAAGGIAMLVLAAAAAGSAKAAELDGPLLALCQEFHASETSWTTYSAITTCVLRVILGSIASANWSIGALKSAKNWPR